LELTITGEGEDLFATNKMYYAEKINN
jgi:hypothetical protein